jgi:hypothetical protein
LSPRLSTLDDSASRSRPRADGGRAPGAVRPLLAYAASRVLVLVATLPALLTSNPGRGPWPELPPSSALVQALSRWDGAWYVWIAQRGYPDRASLDRHLSDVAFHPLYPAITRLVANVTRLSLPASAVLVATVLGAASAVVIWELARQLTSSGVADRTVLLYVLFPGSFVLSMAYAEALMLAASAACLLWLVNRRWVLAGLAAAVAGASRPNALGVLVACVGVAIVELARPRARRSWTPLAAPALAAVGAGAYHVYLWVHTGDALAWFRSERTMWHDHVAVLVPLLRHLVDVFHQWPWPLQPGRLNDLVANLGLVVTVGALAAVWKSRLPLALKLYSYAALLLPLFSNAVGPRPRMLLSAFPLAIVAADQLSPRAYRWVLVASAVGLVVMTVITTTTLAATP